MEKPFQIAEDVALTVNRSGRIQIWYGQDLFSGSWIKDSMCNGSRYVLDFCALKLKNTEAFIVACAAITNDSIESFDEKAVRQFIRDLNKEWEFVT